MLEVDATKLAPKIAEIIALSGWGVPPLDWKDRHNTTAKSSLEASDEDRDLFAPHTIVDEAMATGVRALLYLWTGWPSDGQMWAAAAPEKERLYIAALTYRQLGKSEESKAQLQQLGENPLNEGLCSLAKELIGDHADALLIRFRDLIDWGEAWEAFAFSDLLDQARDGDFSHGAQEILRKLQWQEFNMLLQRCYVGATGKDITKRDTKTQVVDSQPAWKRNQSTPTRVRPSTPPVNKAPTSEATVDKQKTTKNSKNEASKPTVLGIRCPNCKNTTTVAESARGKSVKCAKCGHSLRVAPADGVGAKTKTKTTARLACPKCRSVANYSISHRGKKVACLKCRTSFMFAAA